MENKLTKVIAMIAILSVTLFSCGKEPNDVKSKDKVKLTATLAAVSTDTHAEAMKEFKNYVEKNSEGRIEIDLYTDATLFTQEEELAAVIGGDADITLTSASWLTTNSPWISMLTSGYIFKNYEHMSSVLNGEIGNAIFKKVEEEQGILPLGAWYLGSREISLTEDKHIKTPEDLNGINLRMPNTEAWLFLGKALGANPTPISFSELYLSLQTGVVDGQDNPLPTIESAKFYEVQKSITLTDHLVDSIWPAINSKKWHSLSLYDQRIILEGISVAKKYCDDINLKKESELIDFFKKKGLKIYQPDKDAFIKHVQEYYLNDELSKSWDKELLKQINDLGAQFK